MTRTERWLVIAAPVAAMATVGLGLELGARGGVRAALVYGAPAAHGNARLAWQVVVAEEDRGMREPLARTDLDVIARAGGRSATWSGKTNDDGVAEALLDLPSTEGVELEVRTAGALLARGSADPEPSPAATTPSSPSMPWAPFARREGSIELDVAVLGERVAPSFPSRVWVRARDATTHAPVAGATVDPANDPSLASATTEARTDSRGWAVLDMTPAGLAVSLSLDAHTALGQKGTWIGGLVASPGAARLVTRARWSPDEAVEVDLFAPSTRKTAYVEMDDGRGRAWAASVDVGSSASGAPGGVAHGPRLAPGLYWVIAASDPLGASALGAGTSVQPFFVATSDEKALALGPDRDACALPLDVRDMPRALETCLAFATASPVPRWTALDGFSAQRALSADRRGRGLAIALGGIALAILLEAALLLRAAARARAAVDSAVPFGRRPWNLAIALLAGLLGFALLAAFLVRSS